MNRFFKAKLLLTIIIAAGLYACKSNEQEPGDKTSPPTVTLNAENGGYTVKTGESIELVAVVENVVKPVFSWKIDGQPISDQTTCTFTASRAGSFAVAFRVDAENGSVEEHGVITVSDKLPPRITAPDAAMIAFADTDARLTAVADYAENATYLWRLNGTTVSEEQSYVFRQSAPGDYSLTVKVTTEDGDDMRAISITVMPAPAPELFFDNVHYRVASNTAELRKMTVPLGKNLVLAPVICNIPNTAGFEWKIDGVAQNATGEYFNFTPTAKGSYLISVLETGTQAAAQVQITCTDPEGTYRRPRSAASKKYANKVHHYIPAPGQFVNFQAGSTVASALSYMQTQVDNGGAPWHIGAYGGYWMMGFDHSVENVAGAADLSISGNPFPGWCEPGIVWVMQDENGNGLPDDTWYELKGSETGGDATKQRFAITYFKPKAPFSDVMWVDNTGRSGAISWLGAHSQQYYYPMFIAEDRYMLVGTCLATTSGMAGNIETSTCYSWGYVDNISSSPTRESGLFWIEDAIQVDGSPAQLSHIDFVKVHTATTGKGAAVGEISTEPGIPCDLKP